MSNKMTSRPATYDTLSHWDKHVDLSYVHMYSTVHVLPTLQYLMLRAGPSRYNTPYRGPPVTRCLQPPIASWRAKFPLRLQEGMYLHVKTYIVGYCWPEKKGFVNIRANKTAAYETARCMYLCAIRFSLRWSDYLCHEWICKNWVYERSY